MKKSNLLILSSFAVLGLVSCGATGYTHPQSSDLHVYSSDLNHDGKIEAFKKTIEEKEYTIEEENLTWEEAYDTLLAEAASTALLNEFADNMGIAKAEPQRTNLARYEIMHQAEELLMSTGAMIPLYNYQDPYLLKTNISGIYCSGIAGKFFDQLTRNGKEDENFSFSIGTKANSFDPAVNDDAATANVITNCYSGICKWEKDEQEIPGQSRTYGTHIAENYEILDKNGAHGGFKREVDETYGTATYTFDLKQNLKFTTGKTIDADSFIWAWNRAASPYTGTWVSMFQDIKGYDDWMNKCSTAIKEGKPQPPFIGDGEGMSGITKLGDYSFKVELVNDCAYFKDLLAFPAYLPLDRETIVDCEKNGKIWWLDPKTFATNGRFKITSLNNVEAGGVKMERWDDYQTMTGCTKTKAKSMYLMFLDSDSAMWDKYKSNALDMIDSISTSLIETVKKERPDEWRVGPQVGIYYFLHNVNDNTFDIKPNQTEKERENLRKAFNLLLDRYDYTQTIVRSGATDANGFVSSGITEQCIPGLVASGYTGDKAKQNGLWCKRYKMDGGQKVEFKPSEQDDIDSIENFTLDSADWHERNKDMSEYWNTDGDATGDKLGYTKHWLQNRTKGGFYDTVQDTTLNEKEVMTNNITKAIELAKSAGVTYSGSLETGKFNNFPSVTITTNTGTGHEAMCERIQAYLHTFNIEVKIETQEWNAFQTTKKRGAFAIGRNGWIADYSDPLTYLAITTASGPNNDTQLGKEGFHRSR